MLKFETYIEMDNTNFTEVKEFIFRGDAYKFVPYSPETIDFSDKNYSRLDDKVVQNLKDFIAVDNARYSGIEIAFHCYETERTLCLYCEDGFMKNFWESNEFQIAE